MKTLIFAQEHCAKLRVFLKREAVLIHVFVRNLLKFAKNTVFSQVFVTCKPQSLPSTCPNVYPSGYKPYFLERGCIRTPEKDLR